MLWRPPVSNTIWKIFYSLEQQVGYNPIKSYWLPLALNDAALLHSFIGCAGIFTGAYRSSQDTRGLKHLQASISIVQQRLTSQETLIESVVVPVVAGVALLEVCLIYWRVFLTTSLKSYVRTASCWSSRKLESSHERAEASCEPFWGGRIFLCEAGAAPKNISVSLINM